MTTFQRGTARREGVINADIGNVWALITDWGNLGWWGNDIEEEPSLFPVFSTLGVAAETPI